MAGALIGSSRYASERAESLFNFVKNGTDDNRVFHGAGSRYNEAGDGSDALVWECKKYLPEHVKNDPELHPMKIQVFFGYFEF